MFCISMLCLCSSHWLEVGRAQLEKGGANVVSTVNYI